MKKRLFFLFFIVLLPLVFFPKSKVLAFPSVEMPNLISENATNNTVEIIGAENNIIDYSEYTEEEQDIAESIVDVLDYLDASLAIEENSSTIIAGKKVICDETTGELEEVSCVYSTNLLVNKVIAYALTKEGCSYSQNFREAIDIFDCSSFVRRMYEEYSGVYIGCTSGDIAETLNNYQVNMTELEPGDLLWYPGHIVLYIGNGQIIHAANERKGVIISSMYYTKFTRAFRPIDYIKEIKGASAAKSISW